MLSYGKKGGKRIITVSSESKVICISSVNKLMSETQANVRSMTRFSATEDTSF